MKAFRKTKQPAAEAVAEKPAGGLPVVSVKAADKRALTTEAPLIDYITGDGDGGDNWRFEGCRIAAEAFILLRYAVPAQLIVRVGEQLYEVCRVSPSDPAIAELRDGGHMTGRGPSPGQIASDQRKAAERQAELEADAAYARSRSEHHLKLRQQAEERERQARAAMRASRGDAA